MICHMKAIQQKTLDFAQQILNQVYPHAILNEYQSELISAIINHESIILTHQRGIGKKTALLLAAAMAKNARRGPILVVTLFASSYISYQKLAELFDITVKLVSGNNSHQFDALLQDAKKGNIDLIIVSVEQFVNLEKLEKLLEYTSFSGVFIDEAHAASSYSVQYAVEYTLLNWLFKKVNDVAFILDSSLATEQDIHVLQQHFPFKHIALTKQIFKPTIVCKATSQSKDQLAHIVSLIKQSSALVLIVAFDFDHADWLYAHLKALLFSVGVVHRKVEETSKVETINHFNNLQLDAVIISNDTDLGLDHPAIDTIIYTFMPLNKQATLNHAQKGNVNGTLAIIFLENQFNYDSYSSVLLIDNKHHQEAFNIIKKHPNGISMREIEHTYNIDSYQLEKIVKALKVKGFTKKESLVYQAILPEYKLDQDDIDRHHQYFYHQYQQLNQIIKNSECLNQFLFNHQHTCSQCSSCNPDILPLENLDIELDHHTMMIHPKKILPKALYPKAIIPHEYLSKPGYTLVHDFSDKGRWVDVMIKLIVDLKAQLSNPVIISLSEFEASEVNQDMLYQVSKATQLELIQPFLSSDKKIKQKEYKNPYHSVSAALSVLTLDQRFPMTNQDAILLLTHKDQGWFIAIATELLLSNKIVSSVTPIAWKI